MAELMKIVLKILDDHKNDPRQVIRPPSGARDLFYIIPENSNEIKSKHEEELISAGIDVNLFGRDEIKEIFTEVAWMVDTLFTSKFQI